ncbi:MAG: hypothetical protein Q8942_10930 [Bacillota bacterium]|nr:hypothetical protein [Bacillota bacterium]
MKEINLFAGGKLIVDDADYEIIKDYNWSYTKEMQANGDIHYSIYTRFKDGKRKSLHKFLFPDKKYTYVKHINGNKFDYRRENIAVNDFSHKAYKTRKAITSQYRGVSFLLNAPSFKWNVMVCKGRKKFIASFDSEVKAAIAYNIIAKKFYGEKANLNQISPEDYEQYSEEVIQYVEASHKEKASLGMQGLRRQKEDTSSKYVGVYKDKHAPVWHSAVEKDGKRYYLGVFENEINAALAYNDKAIELYGSQARLNEIDASESELKNRKGRIIKKQSSIYKGVGWYEPGKKWRTYLHHNKKAYFLGHFDDEKEAARAYNRKALELFGDKAVLNDV